MAVANPEPRPPKVVVDPPPPEVVVRPSDEIEPAPAEAAEEIRPVSGSPAEPDLPVNSHAVRSDLIPGPRARRQAPPDREQPPIVPPKPAEPESLDRPEANHPGPPTGPNPTALAAVATRGRDHLARGEIEPAIADFDELIRLCPGASSAYFYRAAARHRASQYPEALADYSEAIRLRPGSPFAFIARGQAHHDLGAYDRAIADFNEAIRLLPNDASVRLRRGLARYRSDDFAGALADFDETLRLDPKNLRAREFRSDALARLGGRARPDPGQAHPPAAVPKPPLPAGTTSPPRL